MNLRRLSLALAVAGAMLGAGGAARADYPDHPVKLLVGYPPGGGTDILARLIADKLSQKWSQTVVVENKPGAEGSVAADLVAHSAPDGYTIIMITSNHAVAADPSKLNYDPVTSFAPVTQAAYIPLLVLVAPDSPVKTVKDLVELAKSKPGQLNFGSAGAGSAQSMDMALFQQLAGIELVNVGYKGGNPAMMGLMGGEVDVTTSPIPAALELVRSGKLRAIAVTGQVRSQLLPDVPTYPESIDLNGFEGSSNWYGLAAPAGTSPDVVKKIRDDVVEIIGTPEVQKIFLDGGFVSVGSAPEEFGQTIADDVKKWAELRKALGQN